MPLIYELLSLSVVWSCGEFLALLIPVPGSLLAMALYFILLYFRFLKEEKYNRLAPLILKNLAFFFIPPAVAIMDSISLLEGNLIRLILILIISNGAVLVVTGLVVQALVKGGEK